MRKEMRMEEKGTLSSDLWDRRVCEIWREREKERE